MDKTKRIPYFDVLRVFAIVMVIIIHVVAPAWTTTKPTSTSWHIYNFVEAISRWAVPVFLMISGALFLGRDIPLKKLYGKYILRIVTAFLFWSLIYAVVALMRGNSLERALTEFIGGHYHLWFIFTIIGLYMVQPILRRIVEKENILKYFLILALIFTFLLPEIINGISFLSPNIGSSLEHIQNNITPNLVFGFAGYFVLGYLLSNLRVKRSVEYTLYALGIFSGFLLYFLTYFFSTKQGSSYGGFYGYFSLGCLMESVAIFTLFKLHYKRESRIFSNLAKWSFNVYLIHALLLEFFAQTLGFSLASVCASLPFGSFSPIFAIIIVSASVILSSYAISAILNHIPIIRKYLV